MLYKKKKLGITIHKIIQLIFNVYIIFIDFLKFNFKYNLFIFYTIFYKFYKYKYKYINFMNNKFHKIQLFSINKIV